MVVPDCPTMFTLASTASVLSPVLEMCQTLYPIDEQNPKGSRPDLIVIGLPRVPTGDCRDHLWLRLLSIYS